MRTSASRSTLRVFNQNALEVQKEADVSDSSKKSVEVVGIDIGDKTSALCGLDENRNVLLRSTFATTRKGLGKAIEGLSPKLIVLEAGTHSAWMNNALESLGHTPVVANPRRLALIFRDVNKNDDVDAEKLARLGALDVELLSPIKHRNEQTQCHLALLKTREAYVKARTQFVNLARSTAKILGYRLPSCSSASFHHKVAQHIPKPLRPALIPLLATIETLTCDIAEVDRKVKFLCEHVYTETKNLQTVVGVGPLTALTFVLTLEDPSRFPNSRVVGAYAGLTPRQDRSGDKNPQLGITKAGNKELRRLLITCAHYILGWRGPDTALRRHGERIAERGGKNAKKRAVVAVARKLAVILHRMWITGEDYDPEHKSKPRRSAA